MEGRWCLGFERHRRQCNWCPCQVVFGFVSARKSNPCSKCTNKTCRRFAQQVLNANCWSGKFLWIFSHPVLSIWISISIHRQIHTLYTEMALCDLYVWKVLCNPDTLLFSHQQGTFFGTCLPSFGWSKQKKSVEKHWTKMIMMHKLSRSSESSKVRC